MTENKSWHDPEITHPPEIHALILQTLQEGVGIDEIIDHELCAEAHVNKDCALLIGST